MRTEEPYRKLWDTFMFFENEQTTSRFLRGQYEKIGLDNPQRLAYLATPKVIYGIKQARQYYKAAEYGDIMTKPLLLYYGMMSLARALIATREPEYPSTTSVLKHGLSTRKLKRDAYQFVLDEVRVQKDGVFVVLHSMLQGSDFGERNRVILKDLLSVIPDLSAGFEQIYGLPAVCEIEYKNESDAHFWDLPRKILHARGHTRDEFVQLMNRAANADQPIFHLKQMDAPGRLHLYHNTPVTDHPMVIFDLSGKPHLRYPHDHDKFIPEISLHFMLMFVLGMLCRYETERWGEMILLFSSQDVYVINEFLNLSMRKFPNLILNELFDARYVFCTS